MFNTWKSNKIAAKSENDSVTVNSNYLAQSRKSILKLSEMTFALQISVIDIN